MKEHDAEKQYYSETEPYKGKHTEHYAKKEQRAEKVTQSRLAGRVRGRECVGAAELGTRKNRGFACVRPLLVASSCAARA